MLRILALSIFVLLLTTGPAQAAITRLTPNPTAPIKVDTTNPRYFTYGGKTVALVGISGEFLPHVNWAKAGSPNNFQAENCGIHPVGGVKKYIRCIDQLYAAGLNVMRIWVALNHSPGRSDGTDDKPYDFEQPYTYQENAPNGTPLKKWDLNSFDTTFERNLFTVVKYAQDKGVIVELTLFNPFVDDMSKSPWLANRHTALAPVAGDPCPATTNAQFSSHSLFVRGDKASTYVFPTAPFPAWNTQKDATFIDNPAACANAKMRRHQVIFMRRMVDLLNGRLYKAAPYNQRLHNFYWELANEPDGSAANMQQTINWHYFMAWQLREYEKSLYPASYHLIAVNYALQPLFEDLLTKASLRNYVDIAAAHYVRKGAVSTATMTNNDPPEETGDPGTPPEEEQFSLELPGGEGTSGEEPNGGGGFVTAATQPALGAMDMIRTYNKYDAAGLAKNNKIWAFNEGRITGFSVTPQTPNPATAASARAEAWEFMFAGGGVYDHMGFNWANLSGNATSAEHTRADLGRLYSFIGDTTLDLKNMKRDETWISSPMTYPVSTPLNQPPGKFFAMMRNTDTFFLYRHNSRFSSHNLAGKYDPVIAANAYTDSVTFKNPYNCAATFTAEWITTKAAHTEVGQNGQNTPDHTQLPVSAQFTIAKNGTKVLTSQPYNYDILLRVKETALGAGCTASQTMINSANPAEGVTVTASSELSELYPASSVIDGDRTGVDFGNGGGWMDSTPAEYPDWIQLTYPQTRAVNAVDIYTLRDDYLSGLDVTEEETFSLYGTTDLELQYRDVVTGEWVSIPNAVLAGNDKVLMKFRFDPLFTDAIRVVIHAGLEDQSRIVEIETFNIEESPSGGEEPPEQTM